MLVPDPGRSRPPIQRAVFAGRSAAADHSLVYSDDDIGPTCNADQRGFQVVGNWLAGAFIEGGRDAGETATDGGEGLSPARSTAIISAGHPNRLRRRVDHMLQRGDGELTGCLVQVTLHPDVEEQPRITQVMTTGRGRGWARPARRRVRATIPSSAPWPPNADQQTATGLP